MSPNPAHDRTGSTDPTRMTDLADPTHQAEPIDDPADRALVGAALATLVADEPPLRSSVEDAEWAGRAILELRRRRRRAAAGAGILVAAGAATALAIGPLGLLAGLVGTDGGRSGVALGSSTPSAPSSDVPSDVPSATGTGGTDPAGGTVLAVGFPVGEVLAAVEGALPTGVRLGALLVDIGWRAAPGPTLTVPLSGPGPDGDRVAVEATLTLGTPCALTAAGPVLDDGEAQAAADAVCAVWDGLGRPDPFAVGAPVDDPASLASQ